MHRVEFNQKGGQSLDARLSQLVQLRICLVAVRRPKIELGEIELGNSFIPKDDYRRTRWIVIRGELPLDAFLIFVEVDVWHAYDFASTTGKFCVVSAQMKEFRDPGRIAGNEDKVRFQ